jgi:hypothetical protein
VVVDLGVGQVTLFQTLGDERLDFRLLLGSCVVHTYRRDAGTDQYSDVALF